MVSLDNSLKLADTNVPIENITGVILAGGRATRMGGQDKGLISWQGKCLVEQVSAIIRPQVSTLLISANRNQSHYAKLCHCPVLTDTFGYYAGPLAGIATALQQAQTDYVLFVPCDSPQLSLQLASRLYLSLIDNQAVISVADDGRRLHYVVALIKRALLPDLLTFLNQGQHQVSQWYAQHAWARANFADIPETLVNINTLEEYATLTGNYHCNS
jgi:molybdopterin-guanine dinucleotide biosynthesis protein A